MLQDFFPSTQYFQITIEISKCYPWLPNINSIQILFASLCESLSGMPYNKYSPNVNKDLSFCIM